jgi:hypothetical protein
MHGKLICNLYALLSWQNFILAKSGCYIKLFYHWYVMEHDIAEYIELCDICQ